MGRSERSAGFVIYVDAETAPSGSAAPEFLLLDYGRHWDFPKGHVEAGEDDLTTARRELQEETGLTDVDVQPGFEKHITYYFRHKRHGVVRKTVVFFLARAHSRDITISHEHKGFVFLNYESAIKRLTFPTAKEILRGAWETIRRA